MRAKGTLVVALSVLVATAAAQGSSSSSDVERVMRRYAGALGEREWTSVRTREIEGTFEYTGVEQHATGTVEMKWRAPRSLVETLRGPTGTVTRGFDGTRAWGSHPQAGVRQLSVAEIDEIILEGVLYQLLGVRHWYGELTYGGRASAGGRATEVLSSRRRGERIDRFYFELTTGLPIRIDVWEEGPEDVRTPGEFYLAHYWLEDYRTVEGVAVPFVVRRQRPNSTMTFRFTVVRHNVTLPDSIFLPPGSR